VKFFQKEIAVFVSVLIFLPTPLKAASAPKPGMKCSVVGQTQIVGNKKFTCTRSGSKLIWNKGMAIPVLLKKCNSVDNIYLKEYVEAVALYEASAVNHWRNYLSTYEIYLSHYYGLKQDANELFLKANDYKLKASGNLTNANFFRQKFDSYQSICQNEIYKLPIRPQLLPPVNWGQEIPKFVSPQISVKIEESSLALECKNDWAPLWFGSEISIGFTLHTAPAAKNPTFRSILDSTIYTQPHSPSDTFYFNKVHPWYTSRSLLPNGIWEFHGADRLWVAKRQTFESPKDLCGYKFEIPDLSTLVGKYPNFETKSLALWVLLRQPQISIDYDNARWWGDLLSFVNLSDTKIALPPTLNSKMVGGKGPGGGTVIYVAPEPKTWGRYIEIRKIEKVPCGNKSPLTNPSWLECSSLNNSSAGVLEDVDFLQVLTKCSAGARSIDGFGMAIEATRQLNTICRDDYGAPQRSISQVIEDLEMGGYDDWYMPTSSELIEAFRAGKSMNKCLATSWPYHQTYLSSTLEFDSLQRPLLKKITGTYYNCLSGSISSSFSDSESFNAGYSFAVRYYQ
jgi:hypothetical protein